jgi:uncharacterized protein YfiM (DUF2279 family)
MSEADCHAALAHLHSLARSYSRMARKGDVHDARMALQHLEASISLAYVATGAARAHHEDNAGKRQAISDLMDSLQPDPHRGAWVQPQAQSGYKVECPCGYTSSMIPSRADADNHLAQHQVHGHE